MLPPPNSPSRPNVPARQNMASRTPSAPGALLSGASLQNGRFRVMGPYRPAQPLENRNQTYLAQWVAIDAMQRGDRVALMELPLGDMVPALVERARETLANRMLRLGQSAQVQRVLGSFSERGRHFLILEYFDGMFLSDRVLRSGPLSERLMLNLADELLEVLADFERHSPPTLHGHIAPETVILSPDGLHARLLVPSPALVAKGLGIPFNEPSSLGVGFVAPEYQHGQVDQRSDLYSLGATLYFAATGFDAAARAATIFSPARQVNPTISAPTEVVLSKAVRQVPGQRYQSAAEMQLDVEQASNGEMPTRDAVNNLEPIIVPGRARNGPLAIGGVLSLLLVGVLVAVLVLNGHGRATGKESISPTVVVDATQVALAQNGEGLSSGTTINDTAALGGNGRAVNMCLHGATASTAAQPTDMGAKGAIVAEEKGALALCAKDFGSAVQYFKDAVQDDPSNAEALIYLANATIDGKNAAAVQAKQAPTPVVTIDVAVNYDSADIDVSREVLRGAAIAQSDLNTLSSLPGQTQMRVEIANVGPSFTNEGAAGLADYYTQHIGTDPNHALGIVSWASRIITMQSSGPLLAALTSLKKSNVPVIAPIATTDRFGTPGAFPNFFQLSPTDQYQAGVMTQLALSPPFSAYSAVVVQGVPAIVSDQEIAQIAAACLSSKCPGIKGLNPNNVKLDMLDQKTNSATIDSVVKDVQTHSANVVLFAGPSHEALQLTLALAQKGLRVPVIASALADDPSLLGQGGAADAQLAAANPQAMQLLHVLSLADELEWSAIPQAKATGFVSPSFFNDFSANFPTLTPSANAIFAYDAVLLMMDASIKSGILTASKVPTPQQVLQALSQVGQPNGLPAFQGVSGEIAFDKNNIPANRSLFFKGIGPSVNVDANGNHPLAWQIEGILPAPGAFCASATCAIGFP